ncbi:MAG: type II secretion system protein M [Gammaproteobacteria bacterium]|nr:type II secretion system protein M [Gammaproteobacteria bacterium]
MINTYMQQFVAYWAQLRPRERLGLIAAAVLVLLTMIYLLLWEPVFNESNRLKHSIEQQQELVGWMRQSAAEAKALRGSGPQRFNGSLLGLIDSTAKNSSLGNSMKRVEPDGSDRVRVWMEQASFDELIHWLNQLQRNYGVQITSVVIDRMEGGTGFVNARFEFSGASS